MNRDLETTVGVIGLGTVGGTLLEALRAAAVPCRGYDPYLEVGAPESLVDCQLVFLCVQTPAGEAGELDTSAIWKAVRDVEANLADETVISVKSTVPPGTCDALSEDFPRFAFAMVPEFLVAARAVETLTQPDRVVIGAPTIEVGERIRTVMRRVAPRAPILMMRPVEAELVKLSANAMLAAKVSVANELALVCERYGVSWSDIQAAVGMDRRIGPDHLNVFAERGFRGGCLPKDLDGLAAASAARGYDPPLLRGIASFNRSICQRSGVTEQPTYRRATGVLHRDLGNEVLAMVPGGEEVHQLTGSSALLWDVIEPGATAPEVVRQLGDAYGTSVDVLAADVEQGLQDLVRRGLASEVAVRG